MTGAVPGCVYCEILAGERPAEIVREWPDAIAILPRRRWPAGHTLVLPYAHVRDALAVPAVTLTIMARMLEIAERDCNLIFNVGPAAEQTVDHLHGHIVPRRPGDGLLLPWTGQAPYREEGDRG